jgi:hypothetical protein
MCDSRRGLQLEIGLIDHFNTRLVTTINYSANVNLYTLEIIAAHAKSFQSAAISTSRALVTGSTVCILQLHRLRLVFTSFLKLDYELTTDSVKVKVSLRLTVYRQSVDLGVRHLETHDQRLFFSTELFRSLSLYNTLSDENMTLSLINMLGLSSSVRIALMIRH